MPNYDDLHYIFLTEKCGLKPYMYDYINVVTYIGVLFFTIVYSQRCGQIEVKTLILVQLSLFMVSTVLMLVNSLRLNLQIKQLGAEIRVDGGFVSDIILNGLSFFLGIQAITSLACLPM